MSIFASSDHNTADFHLRTEQRSAAIFLDLPLAPDMVDEVDFPMFDVQAADSESLPRMPHAASPAGPFHDLREGPGGWGPRVRRRRVPRTVLETSSPSAAQRVAHRKGHWIVALLILSALPLGATLGYYLSLAPPVAVLAPELLDFGVVAVGEVEERQAILENRGEQELRVLEVILTGRGAAEFSILGEGCRGAVLQPGERCPLRVAFRPGSQGGHRAEILLRSNAVDERRELPLLAEGR